jgi:cell division protease FtsH
MITIVPRGRALGLTASLPEEDRHTYTKEFLLGDLAVFFGGRAAEELIFGEHKITTGAGNDIERATRIARRMVTQFGMSETVGLMAVGESDHEVFLGREIGQRQQVSERTAEMVDGEVKRLLDEGYQTAVKVLQENRELLEALAQALLERETLDRDEVEALARGEALPDATPRPPLGVPGEPPADPELEKRARDLADRARQVLGQSEGGAPGGNGAPPGNGAEPAAPAGRDHAGTKPDSSR